MTVSVTLERGPDIGGWRTAALVRRHRDGHVGRAGAAFWVEKRPLAVLLAGPTGISCFAPSGQPLDLADLRRRHPDALARFEAGETGMRGDASK